MYINPNPNINTIQYSVWIMPLSKRLRKTIYIYMRQHELEVPQGDNSGQKCDVI